MHILVDCIFRMHTSMITVMTCENRIIDRYSIEKKITILQELIEGRKSLAGTTFILVQAANSRDTLPPRSGFKIWCGHDISTIFLRYISRLYLFILLII